MTYSLLFLLLPLGILRTLLCSLLVLARLRIGLLLLLCGQGLVPRLLLALLIFCIGLGLRICIGFGLGICIGLGLCISIIGGGCRSSSRGWVFGLCDNGRRCTLPALYCTGFAFCDDLVCEDNGPSGALFFEVLDNLDVHGECIERHVAITQMENLLPAAPEVMSKSRTAVIVHLGDGLRSSCGCLAVDLEAAALQLQ